MTKRIAKKVLVIGWDAADWKVINPLLDAGKMPALEKLINNGVMGNIATLNPILSPMLWTSIATGMRPYKHGIHGFTEYDPATGGIRPVTNQTRKVKAIWNILNQNGFRSNVMGWWPSHPAEPINGVMVSDLYHRAHTPVNKPWPMRRGTVHPERLAKDIAGFRIHPGEITAEQILPFVPGAAGIDQEKDPRLGMLSRILADCSTVHASSTAVMQLEPWDFMAIYYDAIDHFGHGFMKYHPPRQKHIPEKDFELYKDIVESGYRFHDMMLGVLLQLAGEDTTVILISDHGFHPDDLRAARIPAEPAGPAVEHRQFGIFVMKGPGIKKDETVFGSSLLDITPTILTLFGLPIGNDMDGKPLAQAFEEPLVFETIHSWEKVDGDAGLHPPDKKMDPTEAMESIKHLVALGYIEDPGDDKKTAVNNTIRESDYNLARDYIDASRHGDALPILEKLWRDYPDEVRFANYLANCYQALDRLDDCRFTVEEIIKTQARLAIDARKRLKEFEAEREKNKSSKEEKEFTEKEKHEIRRLREQATPMRYGIDYMLGSLFFAEGKTREALEHLQAAEQAMPRLPNLHLQIGNVLLKMKRWEDAERAFRKALEIDDDNAQAHYGICSSLLPRGGYEEAAEEALTAVGLLYFFPQAHFQLGVALNRIGYVERAVEALHVALSQNPGMLRAHRRLARIYKHSLNDSEKADTHSELAKKIQRARESGTATAINRVTLAEPPKAHLTPRDSTTRKKSVIDTTVPRVVNRENLKSDFITVVSGLPRSGTSMMMQMLSVGGQPCLTDEERTPDDDNPQGYFELEKVKQLRTDSSWVHNSNGKAVKIIAQLLTFLPRKCNYRIIFMERNIEEITASQNIMLKRKKIEGATLSDKQLQETFVKQVESIKNMLSGRDTPVLYLPYMYVLKNTAKAASSINDFLGNGLNEQEMIKTVNKKLYRQRLEQTP